MSAPAVKPALSAPSGAQAPRVGSGAPNTTSSNPPPASATAAQKLPPSPVGVSVSMSPMKPTMPPNANHAVPSVPLSLVQEHKAQGNALPQPPVAMPRTPEKPKDLVTSMVPPSGPKPTSNGVEGSPGKVQSSPVQLSTSIAESKKIDDAMSATAILNHSADSAAPASAAGPISASPSTAATNASVPPSVPTAPIAASSNATSLPSTHSSAVSSQQSPTKPESVSASAAASTGGASAATATASAPGGAAAAVAAAVPAAVPPAVLPPTPQPLASPPKSSASAPTTNSSSPTSKNDTAPASVAAENKPAAAPAVTPEEPAPTPAAAAAAPAPASGPGPGAVSNPAPAPEVVAKPAPPAPPEVTKTRIEISKPEFKVATTPRISKRKREAKPVVVMKVVVGDSNDDRKSKRVRTRTQPYQSPLPELQYIAKIKNLIKGADDKLIVFYKNEFLAVRNAEGSFYVCQAMQNIYKSSTRIRIRWLSQDKKENKDTNVYIPDFYDVTEFDCILTNLELKKLDKNKYQLPQEERDRTQNILKRALDVEKGVGEKPPITEEHPDGLDLSLYRDEAQLKKKRSSSKVSKKAKKEAKSNKEGKTEEGETETSEESQEEAATGDSEEDGEKKKAAKPPKSKANKKEKAAAKGAGSTGTAKEKTKGGRDRDSSSPKKERTSERGREREATKRRAEAPTTSASSANSKSSAAAKPPPEKKAKVATTPKPARKVEKVEPAVDTSLPTRSTKSRSAKTSATTAATTTAPSPPNKTSPVTRTKERERRGASATGSRKKPGKKA